MAFSWRLFIVMAFAIAAALPLSGCLTPGGPGPSPSPSPNPSASAVPTPQVLASRYAEIVFDDPACANGYCFEEYMLFADGKILKKFVSKDNPHAVQAEIRQATREKANELLVWANSGWVDQNQACEDCPQFHAIYHDAAHTRRIIAQSADASAFVKEFFQTAKALYGESATAELFYAQLFYKKTGASLVDYHFFADGTVVHEVFDGQDNLVSARVLRVDGGRVRFAVSGGLESGNSFAECLKQHYDYSYLDIILTVGSKTGILTCGVGGSSADLAYRTLRALVEP